MSNDNDYYTDEPISLTAPSSNNNVQRQWDYVGPEEMPKPMSWLDAYKLDDEDNAPEQLKQLLEMIRQGYWSITNNKSFYEQAVFMAGYNDDVQIVPFNSYFPTYRMMSVGQMRSYFTIRKLLRQGKYPDVSISYLFVYVYETIMQIGVDKPEEGYEILCALRDNYPALNPKKHPYLTEWIKDYVVWYNLPEYFADCFAQEREADHNADVMDHYKTVSDEELFSVFDSFAKKVVSKGALFKKQQEAAISGVAFVIRKLSPIIYKLYGHKYSTLCFGRRKMTPHPMFKGAVFYAPEPIRESVVDIAPLHRYVCKNGLWTKTDNMVTGTAMLDAKHVGRLLHAIDALIRKKLAVKPSITFQSTNLLPEIDSALPPAVDDWMADRNVKARESINIDLSKLGRIRSDAAIVRDALIVDDASEDASPVKQQPKEEVEKPVVEKHEDKPVNLEKSFIQLLLQGGDYKAFLRENHIPAGVMVEKINDMAMDRIGDIVLEDDGEQITIIEDYKQDIINL